MKFQDACEYDYESQGELLPTIKYSENATANSYYESLNKQDSKSSLYFIIPYLIGMVVGCVITIVWGMR